MSNEEQYTLTYEYGDIGVTMNIGSGLSVEDMLAQFENFLLATGFRLPEGQSVGLVQDDAPESKVEGYIGGLFDDNGADHLRFDGANAWGNEVAVFNFGVRGGMDDDIIRLS